MTTTTVDIDPQCPEQPWMDEIGCDAHDDGAHRCHRLADGHRGHLCRCGAMVIEDRRPGPTS